ncbi:MAG: lipid-A-disaccharide synthase, partial [Anaerolineae bacterium]
MNSSDTCDLFIFAGEPSADLHGENLMKALLEASPHLRIVGVGGPRMRALNMECLMPMEAFQVMGFVDVFLALPRLIRQFYEVRKAILTLNPRVVLFIDYPGFNLRMAKSLRKKKFGGQLCHYICPSVWAWGKKRVEIMAQTLTHLFTILPFEADYFSKTSLNVHYVGHPLVSRIQHHLYQTLLVPNTKRILSIFPGSRTKELKRNFPVHLKAAKRLLLEHRDLLLAVSVARAEHLPLLQQMLLAEGLKVGQDLIFVDVDQTYELMKSSTLAVAKSGTVTLELGLHQVPTVVTYGLSLLDLWVLRDVLRVRLPYYCLVNIICGKQVFPELIGPNLTEERLYRALSHFLLDPSA